MNPENFQPQVAPQPTTEVPSAGTHLCPSVTSAAKEETASPKILVIVPVYKVEKYLPECIESILAQTFPDFELILVDDGSPDNSGKICDDYAAHDSRIRVFHKENGGVSSARNLGVKNARADYIAFPDSDDWWEPEFLEKMTSLAQKYPQACCWMTFSREAKLAPSSFFVDVPLRKEVCLDLINYAAKTDYFPVWTGSVIIKKQSFWDVGGFDENLVVYEDYKLWFSLCQNKKTPYLNEALAVYRLDAPVENKSRGKRSALNRHWVSFLDEYDDIAQKDENVKRFLDRFRLFNLLPYRGIKACKNDFNRILAETSLAH